MSNELGRDRGHLQDRVFVKTAIIIGASVACTLGFYLVCLQLPLEKLAPAQRNSPPPTGISSDSLRTERLVVEDERRSQKPSLVDEVETSSQATSNANNTINQVSAGLSELLNDIANAEKITTALLMNDDGRRVATFPELVEQFAALSLAPIPNSSDHSRWSQRLNALRGSLQETTSDQNALDISSDSLGVLLTTVEQARIAFVKRKSLVRQIVASASQADPGQLTLEAALTRHAEEENQKFLHELVAAKRAITDETNSRAEEQVLQEHRRQEQLLGEQRMHAARLETIQREEETARIAATAEKLQRDRARTKLLAEFRREQSTVNSLLAPFLDRAITQPSDYTPIGKGGIPRPTSLSALRSYGALEQTDTGINKLFHVGGHPANMRTKGSFPAFVQLTSIPNSSVRSRVLQAQKLLQKYGELMVEEGLLSQ